MCCCTSLWAGWLPTNCGDWVRVRRGSASRHATVMILLIGCGYDLISVRKVYRIAGIFRELLMKVLSFR